MEKPRHIPVLLEETVASLVRAPGTVFVDGTVGGGGHLARLLELRPDARVIGLDRDSEAIQRVKDRFRSSGDPKRISLFQRSFGELGELLAEQGIARVDGIMLDLGFSSFQVDDPKRGFSFLHEGPLDMRMDCGRGPTAADVVNTWDASELARIFRDFGEERFARKVAESIVRRRVERPFTTTSELARVVSDAIPAFSRRKQKIHPATRVFQALRIVVNREIEELERVLSLLPDILNPGGAAAVLTFHSLEDRPVKRKFKLLTDDCICPPAIPTCARCHKPPGFLPVRKPVVASAEETQANPRARSAKLRVFVRGQAPKS